jgi:Sensors of blue-light using FAD
LHIQLLYVSRAVGPQTSTVTASILTTAQTQNARHGIGGVLCQGQGLYLQVLEGERSAVNRLFARIVADARHKDVELLHLQEVEQRRFAAWSMAHVELRADDPMVLLQHPEFDPYSATGKMAMRLVDELCAAGQQIQLPAA